jgi:hypothetical protein
MIRRFTPVNILRLTLAFGLTGAGLCRAAQDAPPASAGVNEASFVRAVGLFDRARSGESAATEPAVAAFDALVRNEPQQPVYAAYLGSALTLKGRDAWMPWNKMRYVEQGTDRIDGALAALKPEHDARLLRGVPASIETLFVAATTFVKIPDAIFHRRGDGKRILVRLLAHPALAAAPQGFRAAVQLAAADEARRDERRDEEAALLKQAIATDPTGPRAERARERLKELGQ